MFGSEYQDVLLAKVLWIKFQNWDSYFFAIFTNNIQHIYSVKLFKKGDI